MIKIKPKPSAGPSPAEAVGLVRQTAPSTFNVQERDALRAMADAEG